jgi:hypothetical protein
VLARDRHRCVRCGSTEDLIAAHHPRPLREFDAGDTAAYNPKAGVTLCKRCHRALDPPAC